MIFSVAADLRRCPRCPLRLRVRDGGHVGAQSHRLRRHIPSTVFAAGAKGHQGSPPILLLGVASPRNRNLGTLLRPDSAVSGHWQPHRIKGLEHTLNAGTFVVRSVCSIGPRDPNGSIRVKLHAMQGAGRGAQAQMIRTILKSSAVPQAVGQGGGALDESAK